MLYRVHGNLLVKRKTGETIRRGTVSCLPGISKDKVGILLARGHITIVQAPPWDAWGGWKVRGERLDVAKIDPIQFIEMSVEDIVTATHSEDFEDWHAEQVTEWQDEVKARLGIGSFEEHRR